MVIINTSADRVIVMPSIDQETKKSLKNIFGARLENLKSLSVSDSDTNDDLDSLDQPFGQSIINKLNRITTNDVAFGHQISEFNHQLEQLVEKTQHSTALPYSKILFNAKERLALECIDSIFMIASRKDETFLKNGMASINQQIDHLRDQLNNLNILVLELEKIINAAAASAEPHYLMRMNLLRQAYIFNKIRIESVENLISLGTSALQNAQNYLDYAKPNLDTKVKLADVDQAMSLFIDKTFLKFNRYNLFLNILGSFTKIAFVSLLLFCLINTLLNLTLESIYVTNLYGVVGILTLTSTIMAFLHALAYFLTDFHKPNYINFAKKPDVDLSEYKANRNELNFILIWLIAPISAFLPFYNTDLSSIIFYDLKPNYFLLITIYIAYKIVSYIINAFDRNYFEIMSRNYQIYLSYQTTLEEKCES